MDNGTLFSKLPNETKNKNRAILGNDTLVFIVILQLLKACENLFKNLVAKN